MLPSPLGYVENVPTVPFIYAELLIHHLGARADRDLHLHKPRSWTLHPATRQTQKRHQVTKRALLVCGTANLSGEGIGLGLPVAKFVDRVVFLGRARADFELVAAD